MPRCPKHFHLRSISPRNQTLGRRACRIIGEQIWGKLMCNLAPCANSATDRISDLPTLTIGEHIWGKLHFQSGASASSTMDGMSDHFR